ncbi:MAG: hypothetical protein NPIRA02_12450 [Nitrospirales bacterium]|nr:MAG: hypothetical protein NPIRA02_12450 [Nitrospirales bacterium]
MTAVPFNVCAYDMCSYAVFVLSIWLKVTWLRSTGIGYNVNALEGVDLWSRVSSIPDFYA